VFSLSLVIQLSWVLAFSRRQCIFAFVAGLFKDKVYPLSISFWCFILLSAFDSIGSSEGSTYHSSLIAFVTGLLFKDKDFILFGALVRLVLQLIWRLVFLLFAF